MNLIWSYRSKMPNLGQNRRFFPPCNLEIWQINLKTIGYLFYATSSIVHHFVAIGELKLEWQFGNAQNRLKIGVFCPVRPWNLTDDIEKQKGTSPNLLQAMCIISYPLVNSNWSCSPETSNLGENRRFCGHRGLQIWQITLKNNRVPLLCFSKLCASFRSHLWI